MYGEPATSFETPVGEAEQLHKQIHKIWINYYVLPENRKNCTELHELNPWIEAESRNLCS